MNGEVGLSVGSEGPGSAPEPMWRLLSQTGEYALRAVLHVARRSHRGPIPVPEIAAALDVPEKYLARVLNTLAHGGTLRSVRGARGGFLLSRSADAILLAEVLAPFERAAAGEPRCLLRGEACGAGRHCAAHAAWRDLAAVVQGFFDRTTVAELLGGRATVPAELAPVAARAKQTRD